MTSSLQITLKAAADLQAGEIAACYALIARTGFHFAPGYLEAAHLVHNPTMVLAHDAAGQLVGVQSYSVYHLKTPFRRRPLPLLYGGIAFQDASTAGRGIAHQLSVHFMRHAFGTLWPLRAYAFLLRTPNPKLMQLMGLQHQLYLAADHTLTPELAAFVRDFVREKRAIHYPIDERLVVLPPPEERIKTDITAQWPLLYRASQESFNQLAHDYQLIGQEAGRQYLLGNYLLVLGRSSRRRLLQAGWYLGQRWWRQRR